MPRRMQAPLESRYPRKMVIRISTRTPKWRCKSALRWGSDLCLAAGAMALLVFLFVCGEAYLFQESASRYFQSEVNASMARVQEGDRKPSWEKWPHRSQPLRIDSLIGNLSIPRLRISVMVLEGAEDQTLRIAAGHVPHTALPGRAGNVVIAAHRDTFFRPLRNVRPNDILALSTAWGSYRYRVESTSIVKPDRVDVMNPTPSPTLTLITCYPFYYVGAAPLRFVVRARQIESDNRAVPALERPGWQGR
jgi:sortase A